MGWEERRDPKSQLRTQAASALGDAEVSVGIPLITFDQLVGLLAPFRCWAVGLRLTGLPSRSR